MRPVPLIRASVLAPLFAFLDRVGAPCDETLELARARLRNPLTLLPLTVGGEIWESATRVTGWRDLGLRVGAASRPEEIGALGALVRDAATVGAALELGVRHATLFNSGQRIWLTREDGHVVFHHRFAPLLHEGRRPASEFVLMLWLGLIRSAAGRAWRAEEIHMEGRPPRHAARLEALAQRGVRFEQPDTAFSIPTALLATPLPPPAPLLAAEAASARVGLPEPDFVGSARQAVASLLQLGSPDIAATARAAGTSVRSLQRRLAEEHLSFVQLLDEARCDAARRMLRDPDTKIVEISAELGYTDSANFTRAFRRWTGLSPRAYRRSVVGGELARQIGHLRPGAGRELAERSL